MGIKLFVGGHAGTLPGPDGISREREDLNGARMFSAAWKPNFALYDPALLDAMLDSGAFTDSPQDRLTPDRALERQLLWEQRASNLWGFEFRANYIVSYDLLIDETWVAGERHKRRWTIQDGERAVGKTVEAARYLAQRRAELSPRRLVLSAQGVDAMQYAECANEVLKVAEPGDIFGLGGWCILGRQRSLLPEFWRTLYKVLPAVAEAGVQDVHIFGVLWQPALGGLLCLADRHGLNVSTDSTAPVMACTWKDKSKSCARRPYWRDNVDWWKSALTGLRHSEHYRQPPNLVAGRQLQFAS
jgi:hypothetical protein